MAFRENLRLICNFPHLSLVAAFSVNIPQKFYPDFTGCYASHRDA